MKVISTPDISTWNLTFTCYQCKSQLEAGSDDLQFKEVRKYNYDSDMDDRGHMVDTYYVMCPVCSLDHGVSDERLPHLLKEKAKAKK
jgi:hypothetical protein